MQSKNSLNIKHSPLCSRKMNSFFDLELKGEVDGVATVQVAGPVGGAGLQGEAEGLFLVKGACLGVAADEEFGEALGSPQAAQAGASVLDIDLAETHAVDVHHGKMIALLVLVPQDVAWREIQMQHATVMHHRYKTAQCLGNLLVGAFLCL